MAARNVLFPAFGTPMMPTSATSFNSSSNHISSPGAPETKVGKLKETQKVPFSAIVGALFRAVLKAQFPRPPFPPTANKALSPPQNVKA